jgi:hypothetical protein
MFPRAEQQTARIKNRYKSFWLIEVLAAVECTNTSPYTVSLLIFQKEGKVPAFALVEDD